MGRKHLDQVAFWAWMLTLEDRRFLRHSGIDLWATARAFSRFIRLDAYGGASTIHMQLVRTIHDERERSPERKLKEMIYAQKYARIFSKISILELYTDLAFVSTQFYSVRSTLNGLPEKYWRDFPEVELLLASMLKYPMPVSGIGIWEERVRKRYQYGLKNIGIKNQLALELRCEYEFAE